MTAGIKGIKSIIKWLAGQRRGHYGVVEADALVRNWTYRPSRPDHISALRRRWLARNTVTAPDFREITAPQPRVRWAVYFIYAPDGVLTPAHRFTLDRLSRAQAGLLVVFASASPDAVPAELVGMADALYWKALPGFDFSGYAIGLHAIAEHSPGADAFVMNDSVYGPFVDADTLWSCARWDLTGFTGSGNIENHIQSYAFILRDVSVPRMAGLQRVFCKETCYDTYEDVVFCQESLFARTAAKTMTVGALWYADYSTCADISVYAAGTLIADHFPFVKRSLYTKYAVIRKDVIITRFLMENTGNF